MISFKCDDDDDDISNDGSDDACDDADNDDEFVGISSNLHLSILILNKKLLKKEINSV